MLVYLVRHGESTANTRHLHAGWAQIPLTEKGRADAKRAGELLKEIKFDMVYSSDLLRARQTAEMALPSETPVLTDLIREFDVGELSGKSIEECVNLYGERYLNDKANQDFTFYGGENELMKMTRVTKFLDMVSKSDCEKVVAFCHEGAIRSALKLAKDEIADTRELINGGIYIFEFSDGFWNFKTEKIYP